MKPHIAAKEIDKIADPGKANATGKPEPSAIAIIKIRINKNKSSITYLALFQIFNIRNRKKVIAYKLY
jgi:hypothetical protein